MEKQNGHAALAPVAQAARQIVEAEAALFDLINALRRLPRETQIDFCRRMVIYIEAKQAADG